MAVSVQNTGNHSEHEILLHEFKEWKRMIHSCEVNIVLRWRGTERKLENVNPFSFASVKLSFVLWFRNCHIIRTTYEGSRNSYVFIVIHKIWEIVTIATTAKNGKKNEKIPWITLLQWDLAVEKKIQHKRQW